MVAAPRRGAALSPAPSGGGVRGGRDRLDVRAADLLVARAAHRPSQSPFVQPVAQRGAGAVADLGHQRRGRDQGNAPHRLQRLGRGRADAAREALDARLEFVGRVEVFLAGDLLGGMRKVWSVSPSRCRQVQRLASQPRPCRRRRPIKRCRAFRSASTMSARARTRPRMASCSGSGTQTGVGSPARCSRASAVASRRSVLTRSPGLRGTRLGATTTQSWPRSRRCRYTP